MLAPLLIYLGLLNSRSRPNLESHCLFFKLNEIGTERCSAFRKQQPSFKHVTMCSNQNTVRTCPASRTSKLKPATKLRTFNVRLGFKWFTFLLIALRFRSDIFDICVPSLAPRMVCCVMSHCSPPDPRQDP